MFTENVLLALIAAIASVFVVVVLILVVRYGFRVEIGWLYFRMFAEAKKGIERKELDKIIQEKVSLEVKQHMSALEAYKDASRQFDDDMKALIAHKLSDVQIPSLPETGASQVLLLAARLELLILNAENHYMQAAESTETLHRYLTEKYAAMLNLFQQFSDDDAWVRRAAKDSLTSWWSVVKPNLIATATKKTTFYKSSKTVFSDIFWTDRVTKSMKYYTNILAVLGSKMPLSKIIKDYESTMLAHNVESNDAGE